jgi:hypothetical protein
MPRRHIACQAARLIRNKCSGRATQKPYVRLRPLAYVTGSRPRGSIGSPPEWGAEAFAVWSGHVSAPDPRLALIKAWVFFVRESRDLAVSGPDPHMGSGTRSRGPGTPVEVWDLTRRSDPYVRGSSLSHGGQPDITIKLCSGTG